MRATITPTPSGLGIAVLAAAGLLAAQACDAGGSDPGEGNGNGQATGDKTEDKNDEEGLQEIEFGALTFRVPEEWEPHDMEYSQMPMDGGEEAHDEWLLVQTNPEEECDLDAGITPGEDYGCAHVMLLGPGSIAVGHGLGELSEDNPFALGTNPGPCAEGIETGLEEPANPAEPSVAEDAEIGDETVPYREWALACMANPQTPELDYHLQRTWYLPDALIVDNWSTDGLAEYVAESELAT